MHARSAGAGRHTRGRSRGHTRTSARMSAQHAHRTRKAQAMHAHAHKDGRSVNLVQHLLYEIFISLFRMVRSLLYRFHMITASSCPILPNVRHSRTEQGRTEEPEQKRTNKLNILNLRCNCNKTSLERTGSPCLYIILVMTIYANITSNTSTVGAV